MRLYYQIVGICEREIIRALTKII